MSIFLDHMQIPCITLVGGELLSELPSTSPLVSDDDGGDGWLGLAGAVDEDGISNGCF